MGNWLRKPIWCQSCLLNVAKIKYYHSFTPTKICRCDLGKYDLLYIQCECGTQKELDALEDKLKATYIDSHVLRNAGSVYVCAYFCDFCPHSLLFSTFHHET